MANRNDYRERDRAHWDRERDRRHDRQPMEMEREGSGRQYGLPRSEDNWGPGRSERERFERGERPGSERNRAEWDRDHGLGYPRSQSTASLEHFDSPGWEPDWRRDRGSVDQAERYLPDERMERTRGEASTDRYRRDDRDVRSRWNESTRVRSYGEMVHRGGGGSRLFGTGRSAAGGSGFGTTWGGSGAGFSASVSDYGGITSGYAGRGPKNYQRGDSRLTEEVCERLTEHPEVDASDIEVRVENGEVMLSGTVSDRNSKRMAEDVAEGVWGVKQVHNQIRVESGTNVQK